VVLKLPKPVGLKGTMNEAVEDTSTLVRPVIENGARFLGYATPSYEQVALPALPALSKPRTISDFGLRARHCPVLRETYTAWSL